MDMCPVQSLWQSALLFSRQLLSRWAAAQALQSQQNELRAIV
jgi:hypothetical protein